MTNATATTAFRIFDTKVGDVILPVFTANGTPVNGASGTLAGVAPIGSLLLTTEPQLYQNSGTQASPTWTAGVSGAAVAITGGTINGTPIGGTTPAAGVFTSLSSTGLTANSTAAGLTASTTQTQAGGTSLTAQVNEVATVANASDAATLAVLAPGQWQEVYNDGAHAMKVFPGSGQAIDAAGANNAVTLTNAKACVYTCTATNIIKSTLLGATSA
jgi:hypothetical protein